MVTIEISKITLEAIKALDNRYFFNLFSEVCTNAEEEYLFRDAINEIANAKKIDTQTQKEA